MIKEIYCKLPSDLNYQNKIETVDELEQILQQIRMVLGTKHGQVLGSYHFGIDLQQYLFNYNQSQAQILYNVICIFLTVISIIIEFIFEKIFNNSKIFFFQNNFKFYLTEEYDWNDERNDAQIESMSVF